MKLSKTLTISGLLFSLACAPLISTVEAEAATVVSETGYTKVMSFSKEDLHTATGIELKTTNSLSVYNQLKKAVSWTKLGYNTEDTTRIATRFSQSYSQAISILKAVAANQHKELKVVTVNNPYNKTVNIGTIEKNEQVITPEIPSNNGNGEEVVENKGNENTGSNEATALSQLVKEIDIEIEYKNDSIELEYEVSSAGVVKAEVDNELTGVELKGSKAQQLVESLFEGLDVKNASQETIKNHILTKLNAPKSVKKFDFKVKFADKSKVDFKIK